MTFDLSFALDTIEQMIRGFIAVLPKLALGAIILIVFVLLARLVRAFVRRLTERNRRHRNLGLVLGRLAQAGVTFLGVLIAVTIIFPSFKPGDLIALLGISGVAIGFAFKDIFENFLAGILILLTEPFRVGDQIIVGAFEGTVEDIQTRATYLKTYDGRRVVIPNAALFTDKVLVNTAFEARRTEVDLGVGYGDDPSEARRLMLEAIREVEDVLADPAPDVILVALADSTVNLRARWWTRSRRADVLLVQDQVLEKIKRRLTEHGIDLPFPTMQVLFHDQTEETDGDRRRQREGWPAGDGPAPARGGVAAALAARGDADGAPGGKGEMAEAAAPEAE